MSIAVSFKSRNLSIDFIRVICINFVVFSHTLSELNNEGHQLGVWTLGTGTVGAVGVSLFIILSGYLASLKINKAGTKEFYISKVTGIFPVYWVTYVLMGLLFYWLSTIGYKSFTQFETLMTADSIDWRGVLFTVFGLDWFFIGADFNIWVYPVIGEWYIGFIIILFAITPILHYLMRIYGEVTLLIAAIVAYTTFVLFMNYGATWVVFDNNNPYWSPNSRLLEFVFGMYLPQILSEVRNGVNRYIYLAYGLAASYVLVYLCGGINIMSVMNPVSAPFGCAMSLILIHVYGGARLSYFSGQLKFLSKYAFIVMLVQHLVIRFFVTNIDIGILTSRKVILIFLLNIIASYIIAIIINPIASKASIFLRKLLFRKKNESVAIAKDA